MENESVKCPSCGSDNIAGILWGMPAYDEELQKDLDEGRIVLGGCCFSDVDPIWHCNDCGNEFGTCLDAFGR